MRRREFLKMTALGTTGLIAGGGNHFVGCGCAKGAVKIDHYVPVDKKLDKRWVRGLFGRGGRTVYSGGDLKTIGMPCGGICSGQVYLTGDGNLSYWDIFNLGTFTGYGATNYTPGRVAARPVEQGFGIRIRRGDHERVLPIDQEGFNDVRFCGEYPIAKIDYSSGGVPVKVRLEAFSPFIPLNAADSALPATVMQYTVKNTCSDDLDITLAGWLQNAVCMHTGGNFNGQLINKLVKKSNMTMVSSSAKAVKSAEGKRETIVFADFEGDDYGDWKVEGEAFGKGPAGGTLAKQQEVSGFAGKGLVNTFLGGDDKMHGKLISPEFKIERRFISFLLGGGSHKDKTCINLMVEGEVVRTSVGKNNEKLQWYNWNVSRLEGKKAHIEIVDTESGGWGHINIDQIEFGDKSKAGTGGKLEEQHDFGTMGLAVMGDDGVVSSLYLSDLELPTVLFGDDGGLSSIGDGTRNLGDILRGGIGKKFALKPGQEKTITFVVSWHFPNRRTRNQLVGNAYANRFEDATAVAEYITDNFDRLAGQTRLWHDTYYDSTLPHWLLDRLHSTASTLATETCQWWANDRFWAWEGVGCCHGTCTHVWNYEHSMARLFPELERSARQMQDYEPTAGFDEATGLVRFRGAGWGAWAADGQAGTVLKAYREHQMSADDKFLKRNWAPIRKSLEFLINEDSNKDGILEGKQHNTFDIDFYGANPMIGSLYLGALRAGEEMAIEVGDDAFAKTCRKIFESGMKYTEDKLFNGEYFIQTVDHKKHPDAQYGDGCLSDQVFGQGWAFQVGLGYVYPEAMTKSAIESVWKYNWAPDVGPQNKVHPPERWFARPGEAGLFTCTWPKSKHMGPKSVRYRDEVWTGIEYQAAGHMAWEGMVTEALAICRGIHERYHPSKYNPWNEIECGDHYARGLASWGVLLGLCGFEYHGPKGRIGFAPRMKPDNFKSIFTASEGWGTISQARKGRNQTNRIEVKWGRVSVKELIFEVPEGWKVKKTKVTIGGNGVLTTTKQAGKRVIVEIARRTILDGDDTLEVKIEC